MTIGFDFQPRTRVVFGAGAVDRLGELTRTIGTSAFLVTDPGLVAAGHVERVRRGLNAAGLSVTIFDRVRENPTTREVDQCLEVARAVRPELIIGLGGGSSMDTAKGCNFILTNGGRMQDYWGVGKATKPMLPLIAVPTTAGTGSECQSFALIADEKTHQKMACGDPKAAPRMAILDPLLTVTQPRQVAACTGIDAVAHAVETAVTKKRNELSWLYSREAFRLTAANLDCVLQRPDDLEARAAMQLGAAYAGTAIENSMLGAAHSAANPLTAHFGVIHGQAVGIMLPHVVRFNAQQPEVATIYAELAKLAGLVDWRDRVEQAVEGLIAQLESLLRAAQMPPSLAALNIPPSRLPELAEEAAAQWTAQFNPRAITASDFEAIYAAAL
ncbi:MAG: iron-containing alcohol dehydrogenase [Terrimicrobiaceae bacterium]